MAGISAAEPLRSQGRATAALALSSWSQVYIPTGHPVDEWLFFPLLQAIDLVAAASSDDEARPLLA